MVREEQQQLLGSTTFTVAGERLCGARLPHGEGRWASPCKARTVGNKAAGHVPTNAHVHQVMGYTACAQITLQISQIKSLKINHTILFQTQH